MTILSPLFFCKSHTTLDIAPLPDNCFNFLYGFKIRGRGKGNDLVVAVVYLSFLGDEKETKEVLQWAKKWAKQGPVIILGDFNTGAAINKRLVEALRVEVGLIDKGAGNRGASTTKKGTRIDRLLVVDQVSARFTAPLPLKDMTAGSYHYPCIFSVEWDLNSGRDRITMPLRAHATKLTDLDDSQLSRFSEGLATLVVDDSCVQRKCIRQLSSTGRTGILSKNFRKFAQGPGAQFAFFVLDCHWAIGWHSGLFSFCRDLCIDRQQDKDEERKGRGERKNIKIKIKNKK